MSEHVKKLVEAIETYADQKLWVFTRDTPNRDEQKRLADARVRLAEAIEAALAGPPQ